MFCPQCGQERVSQETSFCSRCGFLLTGAAELLLTGGAPLQESVPTGISARRLGFRRGLYMLLLMMIIAPIVAVISEFGIGIDPWPVAIVVLGLGGGGILRMIYAFMFESRDPVASNAAKADPAAGPWQLDSPHATFLPPQQAGVWLETNDLQPPSVTDPTTRLLKKDK